MDLHIHNGRRQWDYLEVVDRASGEIERIRLDDQNSSASVEATAEKLGIATSDAWEVLLSGGHLTTFGFVRRLTARPH